MGSSLLSTLLMLLAGVLIARVSANRLARWSVPAIVLELLVGVLLGNTVLPFEAIAPLSGLTELGVLTLFFQVGVEVRGDLLASRRGAILRTVVLSALTPLVAWWPLRIGHGLSPGATLLTLAALSATGTGVTLRVLAQRRALATPSGRLLVGVSVLDDLPAIALLTLATLTGSAVSPSGGPGWLGIPPGLAWLGVPLGLAAAALSWWGVGVWARHRPERPQSPLALLILLISCAWVGQISGLTSLLGALWAGVLLSRLRGPGSDANRSLAAETATERALALITEVFLPLYFISVGLRLPVAALQDPQAWSLAASLTVLALFSKAACGLGVWPRDAAAGIDRQAVVFGLLPRGLPGLVFATTARETGLISAREFSAVVVMVVLTTVLGLMLLDRRLARLAGFGQPHAIPPESS
jgi:Kef-type K+ transport system membrane component KefB